MNELKSDTVERKFIDSIAIEDYEIETDTGWHDIFAIHKTIEYQVYYLKTDSGKYIECADDHIVFDENYEEIFVQECIPNVTKIITKDGIELVTEIIIHDEFENMYDLSVSSVNQRYYTNDILSHNTTVSVAFLLHYTLFNSHKVVGVLANKGSLAQEILDRYKLAYENLPFFLQQGIMSWNAKDIELENGSKIITGATGGSAARGYSFSCLMLDEAAFVPMNIWEPFWTSIWPTVSSGKTTKVIIISTPNGLNHFYGMWEKATHKDIDKKSEFYPYSIKWDAVPDRDEEWKRKQIANTSQSAFDQEFNVEFMGGSNTLISSYALKNIAAQEPVFTHDNLKLFELPEIGHNYVISVDVSRGKGLDKSAFSIIDVTEYPFKQVGTFYDADISPLLFPNLIAKVGYDFNDAWLLVENNDVGINVVNILVHDIEYENILSPQPKNAAKFEDGLKTTKYTKQVGCSTMRDLIENEKLVVQCEDTHRELTGFVIQGTKTSAKKYEADDGYNDDLVMTLANFSYLTTCDEFEELQDSDLRKILFEKRMTAIEEDVLPMPMIDDGLDDFEDKPVYEDGFGMVSSSTNYY